MNRFRKVQNYDLRQFIGECEVKACPFCGSMKLELHYSQTGSIACASCNADGPSPKIDYSDRDAHTFRLEILLAMWNKRADDGPVSVTEQLLKTAHGMYGRAELMRSICAEAYEASGDKETKEAYDMACKALENLRDILQAKVKADKLSRRDVSYRWD